jgi:hypothetical protein
MNSVSVLGDVPRFHPHHVHLNEREWIVRLWLDVETNDIEPSLMVAHRCSTTTAEEIEQDGPHLFTLAQMPLSNSRAVSVHHVDVAII